LNFTFTFVFKDGWSHSNTTEIVQFDNSNPPSTERYSKTKANISTE